MHDGSPYTVEDKEDPLVSSLEMMVAPLILYLFEKFVGKGMLQMQLSLRFQKASPRNVSLKMTVHKVRSCGSK